MIDRRRVRDAFGRQAHIYDTNASVQKKVVAMLLDLLTEERVAPRRLLDVGCGTGTLLGILRERYQNLNSVGIDLATGMSRQARENLKTDPATEILTADAEYLPFSARSFDLVLSTSTFQWLGDLHLTFSEVLRVLSPGGAFFFALFGERTLYELKTSYHRALSAKGRKENDRTHTFFTVADVLSSLESAGFRACRAFTEVDIERHDDVPSLLRSLRQIGAGNASPATQRGLAERGVMQEMMKSYHEEYGLESGIQATYEIVYGMGIKV